MPIESINNTIASAVLPNKSAKKDSIENKSQTASTANVMDDTLSINAMTQGIKHTAELDSPEHMVNEPRVAKIRAALQDGSYEINHERLAKKMLQFEFNIPDTT
jgi:negative regulator of flagellin synthesis FlgM